jgi:WhiB family redox-sensing transcriptional regulator
MTRLTPGPIGGHLPRIEKAPVPRVTVKPISVDESDPTWRDKAACLGMDPEDWFPVSELESGSALTHVEIVKAICYRCPVIDSCLSWAMDTQQQFGIWGGMTAKERASLKRRAARVPARDAA